MVTLVLSFTLLHSALKFLIFCSVYAETVIPTLINNSGGHYLTKWTIILRNGPSGIHPVVITLRNGPERHYFAEQN